jgi:hypothetical protein
MKRTGQDAMKAKRTSRRALYLLLFIGWASVAVFGGRDDGEHTSPAKIAQGR